MVTLYTTHCPRCKILTRKLDKAGVKYVENEDVEEMKSLGFLSAPILKVGEDTFSFKEACIWADTYKKE